MRKTSISRTRFGDCYQCGNEGIYVVKVGKNTVCHFCNKKNKAVKKKLSQSDLSKVRSIGRLQNSELSVEEIKLRNELEFYYDTAAKELEIKPRCMECGSFIPKKFYRAATAHIFPKAQFKSVMSHPMNKLFLGAGCGCHQKTDDIDKFSKMKVFDLAISRFKVFEPMITETHKYLTNFKKAQEAHESKR